VKRKELKDDLESSQRVQSIAKDDALFCNVKLEEYCTQGSSVTHHRSRCHYTADIQRITVSSNLSHMTIIFTNGNRQIKNFVHHNPDNSTSN